MEDLSTDKSKRAEWQPLHWESFSRLAGTLWGDLKIGWEDCEPHFRALQVKNLRGGEKRYQSTVARFHPQ